VSSWHSAFRMSRLLHVLFKDMSDLPCSDACIWLFDIRTFNLRMQLKRTRGATCFAIHRCIEIIEGNSTSSQNNTPPPASPVAQSSGLQSGTGTGWNTPRQRGLSINTDSGDLTSQVVQEEADGG
jgi:hypothetical protein